MFGLYTTYFITKFSSTQRFSWSVTYLVHYHGWL